MRRLIFAATCGYAALLALLLALLEWKAESFWLLTVLLFAPPQFFLLPVGILAPAAVFSRQWLPCLLLAGCVLLVTVGYMKPGWNHADTHAADSSTLTLVTHNIGQGNRRQFLGFLAEEKPDAILLQDARGLGTEFERRYPDAYVSARGEFVCVSRCLIQQSRVLDQPNWHGRPVLARYELIVHGHSVALYSVHMPTPRNQLSRLLGARTALAVFGNEELPGGNGAFREWNAERAELYRAVAGVLSRESLPFIAAGDFNLPNHGALYHLLCQDTRDAFGAAGSGYGFTFPGGLGRVAGILGPWLEIDHVLAGHGVEPVFCAPETGILSQHRAVAAGLRLTGAP